MKIFSKEEKSERKVVLVVDDIAANIMTIKLVLKRMNIDVIGASNGLEGYEKAKIEKPNMIIMDVQMPVMNGFEACEKIKNDELTKDIPVMFVTSKFQDIKNKVHGLDIGADDYLLKPFDNLELIARVKVILRLEEARIKLIQKNKHYMEMLSFISHELKNPLSAILGVAETLKEGVVGELTKDQQRMIDMADRNAEYIKSMIERYMSLSKLEKGEIVPEIKELNFFDEVLETVISHIKIVAEKQNKKIVSNVKDESKGIFINSDVGLLEVVVNNLLGNAIKYSDDRGIIEYDLYKEENFLIFSVKNSSDGLTENEMDLIFQKFERLNKDKKKNRKKGTGLGLYNTREILKLLEGTINCESSIGDYVKFTVKIKM